MGTTDNGLLLLLALRITNERTTQALHMNKHSSRRWNENEPQSVYWGIHIGSLYPTKSGCLLLDLDMALVIFFWLMDQSWPLDFRVDYQIWRWLGVSPWVHLKPRPFLWKNVDVIKTSCGLLFRVLIRGLPRVLEIWSRFLLAQTLCKGSFYLSFYYIQQK